MSVSRAEVDLARLQTEMICLRAQLTDAEERAVKVRHYIEMARLYEAGESTTSHIAGAGGNAAHIASMAREALQEHGEPMATRALVDVLTRACSWGAAIRSTTSRASYPEQTILRTTASPAGTWLLGKPP